MTRVLSVPRAWSHSSRAGTQGRAGNRGGPAVVSAGDGGPAPGTCRGSAMARGHAALFGGKQSEVLRIWGPLSGSSLEAGPLTWAHTPGSSPHDFSALRLADCVVPGAQPGLVLPEPGQAEVHQNRPLRLRAHPTLRSPRRALKKGPARGARRHTGTLPD